MSAALAEAAVKERPILFSGPMISPILEGRKTQTRRVARCLLPGDKHYIHHETSEEWREERAKQCPYGNAGDRLWVRETWNYSRDFTDPERAKQAEVIQRFNSGQVSDVVSAALELPVGTGERRAIYAADFGDWAYDVDSDLHWRPSIHMPRWASRITLEITDVRVQRVQEISEKDAYCEGVTDSWPNDKLPYLSGYGGRAVLNNFAGLWSSINENRGYGWNANPWVWCISFQRIA